MGDAPVSDIVERLRADADFIDRDTYDECWEVKETERGKRLREAADAITTLRAENERMREALESVDEKALATAQERNGGTPLSSPDYDCLLVQNYLAALKERVKP